METYMGPGIVADGVSDADDSVFPWWVLTWQSAQGLDKPLFFCDLSVLSGQNPENGYAPVPFSGQKEVFLGHFHEMLAFADIFSCWIQWQILSWFRGYLKLCAETNISGVMLISVETLRS